MAGKKNKKKQRFFLTGYDDSTLPTPIGEKTNVYSAM